MLAQHNSCNCVTGIAVEEIKIITTVQWFEVEVNSPLLSLPIPPSWDTSMSLYFYSQNIMLYSDKCDVKVSLFSLFISILSLSHLSHIYSSTISHCAGFLFCIFPDTGEEKGFLYIISLHSSFLLFHVTFYSLIAITNHLRVQSYSRYAGRSIRFNCSSDTAAFERWYSQQSITFSASSLTLQIKRPICVLWLQWILFFALSLQSHHVSLVWVKVERKK